MNLRHPCPKTTHPYKQQLGGLKGMAALYVCKYTYMDMLTLSPLPYPIEEEYWMNDDDVDWESTVLSLYSTLQLLWLTSLFMCCVHPNDTLWLFITILTDCSPSSFSFDLYRQWLSCTTNCQGHFQGEIGRKVIKLIWVSSNIYSIDITNDSVHVVYAFNTSKRQSTQLLRKKLRH